jgi:carboxymethylenebutenolidase
LNLKHYIESELEEERQFGYAASGTQAAAGTGDYPGDVAVHVPESEVVVERRSIPGAGVEQEVYLAAPTGGERAPAVVVIHENKGLVPYIEDVVRRLARHGYVAAAPDLLSRVGGTGAYADRAEVAKVLGGIDPAHVVADVRAVIDHLTGRDDVLPERVGILGFCYGGGVAWRVLTQEPRLAAGVPFYGPVPDEDAVPGIEAPVLAVFGERDERITSMLPGIAEAMARHGKTFEPVVLPKAQHAFHNDTNPDRYDAVAAREAWGRAVGWLDRWLRDR